MMSRYKNKDFIEAVDSRYDSEYNNRVFKVVYESIPKPSSGIYPFYNSYGCPHTTTINLDDEDITYLYNKYKSKAIKEIETKAQEKRKEKDIEITELEEKLRKLKEDGE